MPPDWSVRSQIVDSALTGARVEVIPQDARARTMALAEEHGDEGTAQEFVLAQVARLLRFGAETDKIAVTFGVSLEVAKDWVKRVRAAQKEQTLLLDPQLVFGESLSFYNDIRATAMREYLSAGNDPRLKLVSLEVARRTENDKLKFLVSTGIFEDVRKQTKTMNYGPARDAQLLKNDLDQLRGVFTEALDEASLGVDVTDYSSLVAG